MVALYFCRRGMFFTFVMTLSILYPQANARQSIYFCFNSYFVAKQRLFNGRHRLIKEGKLVKFLLDIPLLLFIAVFLFFVMAVITIPKLKELVPQAQTVSDSTLRGIIDRTQAIIESPVGCDRPLEKQEFTEQYQLNTPSQSAFIRNLPIDTTAPFIVKARLGNGQRDRVNNLPLPIQPYVDIPADGYDLQVLTGELSLFSYLHNPVYNAYGRTGGMNGLIFTEVEVTYTGGYDFCDTSDREVQRLQINFASAMNFMLSSSGFYSGQGIKRKKVEKEYEIEFFNNMSSNSSSGNDGSFFSIPASLLIPFYKYRNSSYDF